MKLLDNEGCLFAVDVKRRKALKKFKTQVKENSGGYLAYSPNNKHFLISSFFEASLFVFDTQSLKVVASWVENAWAIGSARWIDDERILAPFGYPGELLVLGIGEDKPISRISLLGMDLDGFWLTDVEICKNKREAVVAGGERLVIFKINFEFEEQKPIWCHQQHEDFVEVVKLSNNGELILSSGLDMKLILTRESNGEVVSVLNGFRDSIRGLSWSPIDDSILFSSEKMLGYLRLKGEQESLVMEIESSVDNLALDDSTITGFSALWDQNEPRDVLVGTRNGNVFHLKLKNENG